MSEAPRHDLYGPIHKALRAGLGELLARLGRAEFNDDAVMAETLAALRAQLRFCASHLHHEEAFIHPALLERAPDAIDVLEHDHAEHACAFEALERAMAEVETAAAGARGPAGRRLYLAFSVFVAQDLEHMADEERLVGPLLQSLFTDEELRAMEGAIIGSLAPDEAMQSLSIMIPAMNPAERAAFLGFVQRTAPPEAFAAIIAVAARPTLPANDWIDLAARLGLAA